MKFNFVPSCFMLFFRWQRVGFQCSETWPYAGKRFRKYIFLSNENRSRNIQDFWCLALINQWHGFYVIVLSSAILLRKRKHSTQIRSSRYNGCSTYCFIIWMKVKIRTLQLMLYTSKCRCGMEGKIPYITRGYIQKNRQVHRIERANILPCTW